LIAFQWLLVSKTKMKVMFELMLGIDDEFKEETTEILVASGARESKLGLLRKLGTGYTSKETDTGTPIDVEKLCGRGTKTKTCWAGVVDTEALGDVVCLGRGAARFDDARRCVVVASFEF
jgi:hypothetical protein